MSFDINCDNASCEESIILDQERKFQPIRGTHVKNKHGEHYPKHNCTMLSVKIPGTLENKKEHFFSPLFLFQLWQTVFQNLSVYS